MRTSNRAPSAGITGLLGVVVAAVLVTSCSSDVTGVKETTEFGSSVALGKGTARSYVIARSGVPVEVGVVLSEGALENLPTAPQMGGYEHMLPMPAGNTTQYKIVGLNWNPGGHPPVYMVPHFDIHFYMISEAEKNAILPSDPNFATKAANLPPAAFAMPGFKSDNPANAVPRMGLHWTDANAHEFHGQPFTRTMILGSWDGRFIFIEPMITSAYLQTRPNELVPLGRASQTPAGHYYPGAYRVSWDAGMKEWRIGLAELK